MGFFIDLIALFLVFSLSLSLSLFFLASFLLVSLMESVSLCFFFFLFSFAFTICFGFCLFSFFPILFCSLWLAEYWFSNHISPCYSLELCIQMGTLHSSDAKNWLIGKDPDAGKDWRWEEKGTAEDEMVGWHHQLNGHDFEGVHEGQGGLACCSPWGPKESDTTERLN